MIKFVICNTNKNRNVYCESKSPWWLEGDYVTESSGSSHDDITRAHLYNSERAAKNQCKKLNEKFAVNGSYFKEAEKYGYGYPDSVGKKGYARYAPKYEVVKVEVSVNIIS